MSELHGIWIIPHYNYRKSYMSCLLLYFSKFRLWKIKVKGAFYSLITLMLYGVPIVPPERMRGRNRDREMDRQRCRRIIQCRHLHADIEIKCKEFCSFFTTQILAFVPHKLCVSSPFSCRPQHTCWLPDKNAHVKSTGQKENKHYTNLVKSGGGGNVNNIEEAM